MLNLFWSFEIFIRCRTPEKKIEMNQLKFATILLPQIEYFMRENKLPKTLIVPVSNANN